MQYFWIIYPRTFVGPTAVPSGDILLRTRTFWDQSRTLALLWFMASGKIKYLIWSLHDFYFQILCSGKCISRSIHSVHQTWHFGLWISWSKQELCATGYFLIKVFLACQLIYFQSKSRVIFNIHDLFRLEKTMKRSKEKPIFH